MHRRHVVNLKGAGGVWLVRDVVLGQSEHELEIRWHFAPDLDVRPAGAGRVEVSKTGSRPGETWLTLIVPEDTFWHCGAEIKRTLLSPAYGAHQPAPLVRCHARVSMPAETATVLVPHSAAIQQDIEPRLVSMAHNTVQVYELDYHQNNESHGFFFSRGKEAWSFGPWSSDAQLLYCRIEKEKLTHLVVVGGTRVAWQGQPLLKAEEPSDSFEWRGRDAVRSAGPGQWSVTSLFEELTSDRSSPYAGKH